MILPASFHNSKRKCVPVPAARRALLWWKGISGSSRHNSACVTKALVLDSSLPFRVGSHFAPICLHCRRLRTRTGTGELKINIKRSGITDYGRAAGKTVRSSSFTRLQPWRGALPLCQSFPLGWCGCGRSRCAAPPLSCTWSGRSVWRELESFTSLAAASGSRDGSCGWRGGTLWELVRNCALGVWYLITVSPHFKERL